MDGFNKFKVLTIVFLCMFVFVIAAIYTNTKEVTDNKTQSSEKIKNEQAANDMNVDENTLNQENSDLTILTERVDELSRRLDEISNNNSSSTRLNCKIEGVLEGDSIEPLSPDAAVQEAKFNNKEVVMTCSF